MNYQEWAIIIFILIFLFTVSAAISIGNKKEEASLPTANLERDGYLLDEKVEVGKYILGHPNIDTPVENVCLIPHVENKDLHFFAEQEGELTYISSISTSRVALPPMVEDTDAISIRASVKSLLGLNIFSFKTKSATKGEIAYLVIEWKGEKFNNETIFELEKENAGIHLNRVKNIIMRRMS